MIQVTMWEYAAFGFAHRGDEKSRKKLLRDCARDDAST